MILWVILIGFVPRPAMPWAQERWSTCTAA
jgi:hypothetical protein